MLRWPKRLPIPAWGSSCSISCSAMAAIPTRRAISPRFLAGRERRPLIVASVTGTDADPQPRDAQVETLAAAGVIVADSNADATEAAIAALGAIRRCAPTPHVIVPILRSGVLAREFCRRVARATRRSRFRAQLLSALRRRIHLCRRTRYRQRSADIDRTSWPLVGSRVAAWAIGRGQRSAYRDRQFRSADPGPKRSVASSSLARLPVPCPADRYLRRPRTARRDRCTGRRPCAPVSGVAETSGRQPPLARIARPRIAISNAGCPLCSTPGIFRHGSATLFEA